MSHTDRHTKLLEWGCALRSHMGFDWVASPRRDNNIVFLDNEFITHGRIKYNDVR